MALNLEDPKELFEELRGHVGHKIVCVGYGEKDMEAVDHSIECETCGCVLLSQERPAPEDPATPADTRWIPTCPDCGSEDLEWKTFAFFKVLPGSQNRYVEIAFEDKPASVDYEADGDIYCNKCCDYKGRPKGWDSWKDGLTPQPMQEGLKFDDEE